MKINAILINPRDNVAVATAAIKAGEAIVGVPGRELKAKEDIRRNHKVALAEIPEGRRVIKYGESIGVASQTISAGEWVHTHNLKLEED
jgi:altronate hydrolase